MVEAFVDTMVLVDLIRNYPPAARWIAAQSTERFGITPGVWLELVEGAQNKQAQAMAVRLLNQFEMTYYIKADMDWAMEQLMAFNLSHNIDLVDCLIASVSYRLQLPLYTRNLKHFRPLLGALAQTPY